MAKNVDERGAKLTPALRLQFRTKNKRGREKSLGLDVGALAGVATKKDPKAENREAEVDPTLEDHLLRREENS